MGFAPAGVLPSSSQDSKVAADLRNVSMERRVNVDGAPGVQMYSRNVLDAWYCPPPTPTSSIAIAFKQYGAYSFAGAACASPLE